jgi:trehalose 2-sulfotransferase
LLPWFPENLLVSIGKMIVQLTKSYLLCATPRSGSTLLCEILSSSGRLGRPQEYFELLKDTGLPRQPAQYFNPRALEERQYRRLLGLLGVDQGVRVDLAQLAELRERYREYLLRVLECGTTDNGVFGAKMMWGYLTDFLYLYAGDESTDSGRHIDFRLRSAFANVRYIHVRRRDKLCQAISLWKAIQTQLWREDAGTPRGHPWRHPVFDFAAITFLRRQLEEHDQAWNRFFVTAGATPLVLQYEDFACDLRRTYLQVARHIGIREKAKATGRVSMLRQFDADSESWRAQYLAIERQKRSPAGPK